MKKKSNRFQRPCRRLPATLLLVCLLPGLAAAQEQQQELQDPASDSKVIEETLSKIRQVAELEKYLSENKTLKDANKQLMQQIASLDKQVKKLTQELKAENERLRKQLLELPTFEIKSKVVGGRSSLAVLQFGEKTIRIRQGIKMDVPVADGVWTLMKVLEISNDFIELEFPELDRKVVLYD